MKILLSDFNIVHLLVLGPNLLLRTLVSNIYYLKKRERVSHPHNTKGKLKL
jgi:hypothetical protein